jgi:hypothetical protein
VFAPNYPKSSPGQNLLIEALRSMSVIAPKSEVTADVHSRRFMPTTEVAASFDHLVSKHEQIMRDCKPKCVGCLEVDNELVFDRLLDR